MCSYQYIIPSLQKNITNKQCIVFTSDQYKELYWNLTEGNSFSVINTLKHVKWAKPRKYPPEWTNDCRCKIPAYSSCPKLI